MRGFDLYWKSWKVAEDWRQRHYAASSAVHNAQNNLMHLNWGAPQSEPFRMIDYPYAGNRCEEEYTWEEFETCDDESEDIDEELDDESEDDGSELEFVINEEMIAFFEQSMRHKEELKQQRELLKKSEGDKHVIKFNNKDKEKNSKVKRQQSKDYDSSTQETYKAPNVNLSSQKRIEDMKNLYGTEMPKICGMETALQLSFNRLRDHNKPVYWPCIPFSP